jgi:hypothetical protein
MDISLEDARPIAIGALVVALLVGLALLGHGVSPIAAGRPQVLTPERWLAAALTRQANTEIARLASDAQTLRDTLAKDPPDAIRAMTLAQRIYAAHRTGTAATAPARQTLIAAAEAVARCAAGGLERNAAITALNAALERIKALAPTPDDVSQRQSSAPEGRAATCKGVTCDHSHVRARAWRSLPLALGGRAPRWG